MTTIIVRPKNKKELSKIKSALKLVEVEYEEKQDDFISFELLKKDIEQSRKDKIEGKSTNINPKNIWKSIGL
jgi:hypothetical protein